MSHDRLSAVMGALTGAGPAAPSAARELKYAPAGLESPGVHTVTGPGEEAQAERPRRLRVRARFSLTGKPESPKSKCSNGKAPLL